MLPELVKDFNYFKGWLPKKPIPEQVAQKMKIAINQVYFAVWDMRGAFIRGWDKDNQIDTGDRFFSYGQGLIKNNLGSFQLDEITSHTHPPLFNGQYVFAYPPAEWWRL